MPSAQTRLAKARPIGPDDPHVFDASIEKIEFLGSYCHVHVASEQLQPHKLTVWVDAAPPTLPPQQPRLRSEPPTNPWSGISGAAVLFDGYLIGVMDSPSSWL